MARILVSWIAYNNDFIRQDRQFQGVADTGPNTEFHRNYYGKADYGLDRMDRHILLYSNQRDEQLAERLGIHIRGRFRSHELETELLALNDIGDLAEVKSKVEAWLLAHRDDEIIIFFSPGASIMQLSWYIGHTTLGLRTRLVQTRRAQDVKPGQEGFSEFLVERSSVAKAAVIREDNLRKPATARYQQHILPPVLEQVYHLAALAAGADKATVLIRGESGTGKEQLARAVHEQSGRKTAPFEAINCTAFSESLLISQLFGHKKGSFTGADKDAKGLFEQVEGGTIFLDEIGDVTPAVQAALLRVFDYGEIQPVGDKPRKVNVRIVAATNAALEEKCRAGQFRWDLYYRLCGIELELPALREWPAPQRRELLDDLLQKKQEELRAAPLRLSADVRNLLLNYPFPGNIRELQNTIEGLYVLHADHEVELRHLPRRLREPAPAGVSLRWADVEREHLQRVLALKNGVMRQAALALGMDVRTLGAKLEAYAEGATEAPRQGRRGRQKSV